MKKILTIVAVVTIVAVMSMILAGCNGDGLNKLSREFRSAVSTAQSVDDVDSKDLKPMQNDLLTNTDMVLLSSEGTTETDTDINKLSLTLAIHDEIKAKTERINLKREELKTEVEEIKVLIEAFKRLNIELTEEEKALVDEYIAELKEINLTLRETIGKAYKRMYDLRGQYKLSNIDTIHTTFTEVNEVLAVREENVDRLVEIADEVRELLEVKMN